MLEGIRVVDLTSVLLGPYCTMSLADMGADVIKVEPKEGDLFRSVGRSAKTRGAMGPIHMAVSRGKRSVVFDLKTDAGKDAMRALLKTADVFIHNIRAEAINRLGFGYEDVRALKPDIVYVHCMGFSPGGPYETLPAYDDVIQAASGMTTLLPRVDGDPRPRFLPLAVADKVSGLHALYGTLAALVHKERTGQGQKVEAPMLEAVTSFNMAEHLFGQTFTPPNGPTCYPRQVDPRRQPFPTADGYVAILPYTDANWVAFFGICGRPEILQDPRYDTYRNRALNVGDLYEIMAQNTPSRTTAEWLRLLTDADIPCMQVNDMDAVTKDPHLTAVGFFREREHPTEGGYLEMAQPVRVPGQPETEPSHPPLLGQHTDEILAELGLSPSP